MNASIAAGVPGDWRIYRASGIPHDDIDALPAPPKWRDFDGGPPLDQTPTEHIEPPGAIARAAAYQADDQAIELVNAALYLRRPLLVTGKPGTGKSTLARSIAHELRLGPVLYWPITSRTTLQDGLYRYDAIGRLQDAQPIDGAAGTSQPGPGRYLTLGPLGTALLPWRRPRVLLVDELDKSDIDLPNDLLHVFEEGWYEIPELARLPQDVADVQIRTLDDQLVTVHRGRVLTRAFPIVVITSNGEREFPQAFLRRCVRLDIAPPNEDALTNIVSALLGEETLGASTPLIREFMERRERADVATDQLLNALFLVTSGRVPPESTQERLKEALLRSLESGAP